jgi:hypothetical protein
MIVVGSMNEEKIDELVVRLNEICNNEYQRYHQAINEVARDWSKVVLSPQLDIPKLRLNPERREIDIEDRLFILFKHELMKTANLTKDVEGGEIIILLRGLPKLLVLLFFMNYIL